MSAALAILVALATGVLVGRWWQKSVDHFDQVLDLDDGEMSDDQLAELAESAGVYGRDR